ncbi:cache domain-containing sensor histidine kinase [Cohnella fermenti]|uniref:histidine kinase n=1 Tax=Cohnella fermenti TaxID=2565925 RepID=A0A4S4BMB0_9BACL|nr:sensor histidine kinase [Cohnella fermenti]THF75016.1 sensor histidine kinase [Cohnella fermenti]
MRRGKRNWPKRLRPANRMEGKLLIVFLFLIILPIGILSYISAERYSNSIENNTITYASQLTDKMMDKLDDYLQDMKKISIIPSYLDEIKEGLKMSNRYYGGEAAGGGTAIPDSTTILPSEQQQSIDIQKKIGSSIYFLNNIKSGTNTIYLFDNNGHVYYAAKNLSIRSDLQTVYAEWNKRASAAFGTPVLVSTQEVSQPVVGKKYVFTVVREIIDSSNYETLGMIAVDANIGVIENIVKDLDSTTQGTTLIVDQEGKVIYDSEMKYVAQSLPRSDLLAMADGQQGSFHSTQNGQRVLTIYKQSETTGWRVLITIPESHLQKDAVRTRNFTVLIALVIMSFALLISLVIAFAITRPLRSLVKLMKEVQSGNMDVVFPVVRRDEAGLVGSAFNRMIDRIKTLISDIYAIEQRKKEAELQSLQHQINPHFIYNTLESIRMTAVLNDDSEVGDMAELLGKLLRYSIHAGTDIVPIRREWEHLTMYIELLNYRYGANRFELELPPEETTGELQVMKLLFQPIVENAVYHGFDEAKGHMRIAIECRFEGTDVLFVVRDDGVGMGEGELQRLSASLKEPPEQWDGRGIGLRNIHERLRLRYGEKYGLTVQSEQGSGTSVIVRFPNKTNS